MLFNLSNCFLSSGDIPQNPKHQRFLEPGNEKFKPLISWVQKTRELLDKFEKDPTQKNLMNADRKQRLLDVGFLVKPVRKAGQKFSNDEQLFATRERKYNERFEEMFAKLKEYKAEHGTRPLFTYPLLSELLCLMVLFLFAGHVNIPLRPNNPVRNWLMTQRSMYEQSLSGKKVPLTLQKMAQLQAVGFQFVPPNKKKTTAERIEDWYVISGHFVVKSMISFDFSSFLWLTIIYSFPLSTTGLNFVDAMVATQNRNLLTEKSINLQVGG